MDPNVFETANAGFAQAMYEEFLRDPAAVGPEWRRLFESGVVGERNGQREGGDAGTRVSGEAAQACKVRRCPSRRAHGNSAARRACLPASPRPSGASPIKGPAAKLVANMNESLTVPTATTFRELPVAVLEERRRSLNAALKSSNRPEKISFTHLIAYAIVQATRQHPVMGHTLLMRDGSSASGRATRVSHSGWQWTFSERTAAGAWWCLSSRARRAWTSPVSMRRTNRWWRRRAPTG